ncbi:hypothetical protein HZH66_010012 [Vespula vulgaris]|uniref:Uncharacterized protein n=1 Tax=Vespula vulgaris TaxID=7454 RepID=A0A834MXG9_VESVU|nr:hypothetical protein HZH66_010012 [Vespula vulgaris]
MQREKGRRLGGERAEEERKRGIGGTKSRIRRISTRFLGITGSLRRLEAFGWHKAARWYSDVIGSIAPGKLCAPDVALRGWKLKDEPRYDVVNRKSYFYEVPSHIILGTGNNDDGRGNLRNRECCDGVGGSGGGRSFGADNVKWKPELNQPSIVTLTSHMEMLNRRLDLG